MAVPVLNLTNEFNVSQSVEYPTYKVQLGDNYEQSASAGLNPREETWQVRATGLTGARSDQLMQELSLYSGVKEFSWSPNPGAIPQKTYTCEGWQRTPFTADTWRVEAEFRLNLDGQCLAYAALINEAQITGMLESAIAWLATYTRNTSPLAINTVGLSVNSFHDVLGRGGYFPASAGTTEGQFLLIRALLTARQTAISASSKTQALATSNLLASALVLYVYRGVPIPATSTAYLWLPHWLINVKEAFPVKGKIADKPINNGYFDLSITFTNGVGSIPVGVPNNGDKLSDVYRAYSTDGQLLWRNIFAPLISGTEKEVDYWVSNLMLKGQNYRIFPSTASSSGTRPIATAEGAGKIVLKDLTFTGTLRLVYLAYESSTVGVNTAFEATPCWRNLLVGEVSCAIDTLPWAIEAYKLLSDQTSDIQWQRAYNASRATLLSVSNIQNESYLYKRDTTTAEPFSYAGTQLIIYNNSAGGSAVRAVDGGVQANILDGTELFPGAELQNFAVTIGMQENVTMEVELACSVATLLEISVSTSKNAFDFSKQYTFWLPVPATLTTYTTRSVPASAFIKWLSGTVWHSTNADSPVYTYQGSGGAVGTTRELQAINADTRLVTRIDFNKSSSTAFAGAGFVMFNQGNRPPDAYIQSSTDRLDLKVSDSAGVDHFWRIPNTAGAWTLFQPSTVLPPDFADGAIQSVEIVTRSGSNFSGSISVFYLGEPPQSLPFPVACYKVSIVSRVNTAHSFKAGNVQALNSPLNVLYKSPGVVPFTANASGCTSVSPVPVIDAWRGEAMAGYQSPAAWQEIGDAGRYLQALEFLSASQSAYTNQSQTNIVGAFAPVYYWARWDNVRVNTEINTWGWVASDPSSDWCQYGGRPLEDTAKAWYHDPGNILAGTVAMRFLGYLDSIYSQNQSGQPPTNFVQFTAPEIRYHEPAMAALVCRAALYANVAGGDPSITFRVVKKSLDYMISRYVGSGTMAGTFSAGQPSFVGADSVTYSEWFIFWQAELIMTLALLLQLKNQITYPPCSVVV